MRTIQKKNISVSIVIPNWNGERLLKKNLPAVVAAANGAEIIVADDASVDGSVAFIRSTYPKVKCVTHAKQQGFAANVNSGVLNASGDIVVLLNTDVRPHKDFLASLLFRFSDPEIAAVGCLEESHDAEGIVLRGRGIAQWKQGYFIHARGEVTAHTTAWVSGGSCAYRKDVWRKLGGMDELYNPFYWEDIDLSYQALKSGYTIAFEPKSIVGHFHEEGKIKTSYSAKDVTRIVYRNQFIFHWKNMSDPSLWFAHMVWTPVRLIQSFFHGDMCMIQGYCLAVLQLPLIWKSRRRAAKTWRKTDQKTLPSFS